MSFLSQSFQSQSASNTASIISKENSSQIPLGAINNSFVGKFVPSSNYSVLQLTVSSNTLVEIIVEQSFLGVTYDEVSSVFFNTQEDIDINRAAPFYAFITLPFMRIIVQNIDIINNTKLNLCTKLTSTSPPASEIDPAHVIIDGPVQVSSIIDALPAGTNEIGAVSLLAYNISSESNLPLYVSNNQNLKVVEENSGDILSSIQLIDETIRPSEDGFSAALNTTFKAIVPGEPSRQDASSVIYGYDSSTNTYIAASVIPYYSEITPYVPTELLVREHNSAAILSAIDSIDGKITECNTGAVVVSSGNINIDNFPAIQPIYGSVSITGALPEGTNTIGGINNYAFNTTLTTWTALCIDNNNLKVVEENSGDILTSINSIDGKITACNTGAVVVSSGSITETNSAAIAASVASIDGHIIGCNTDAVIIASGNINIDNFPATQPISGSVSITGTAQVQDLPLENIAGTNAPRPVYNMVVGNWYRVASVGNTAGAVWIQIGSPLFNGASIPDVGVLFKCLYVYLNFSTTGTVWDEPYNTWESDNLVVTSGNLQVVENNSAAIAASVASIDGHIIGCNTDAVIIASGSITETNSAAIAASVASIDGHIIGCNTDAVIIASGSITETNSAAIAASVASIDGHIIGCNTDAVIIASGSITETNSAAIAASVASIDGHIIGCNTDAVIIASGSITETNSAAIAASVASIDSKIIECNTGAVIITTALPSGNNTIGQVNLRAYDNIIPSDVQLNSKANSENDNCLCISDLATINLEINANKANYNYPLTPDIYLAGNDNLTLPIGTNVDRYREAVLMVKVDTTTYTNPQIMFGYSQDDINYYFDGNLASWYDLGSNIKTAVLQRSNIPGAYIRLVFITDVQIVSGDFNLMKS